MTASPVNQQDSSPVLSGFDQVDQLGSGPLVSYLEKRRHAITALKTQNSESASSVTDARETTRPVESDSPQRGAYKPRNSRSSRSTTKKQARKPKRRPRCKSIHTTGNGAAKGIQSGTPTGLKCVRCGRAVKFSNEFRCEDCFADDTVKWSGKDKSVHLHF